MPNTLLLATLMTLLGCSSSPRSQDIVRRSTAAVTRTVASDAKGVALGVRDGLRHKADDDSVDINTATLDTLLALSGMNRTLATRVIQDRPYKHSSDLVKRRILPKPIYTRIAPRLVAH